MIEQLQVAIPDEKLELFTQPDEVFKLIEGYVIAAERQFHGIERGPERLETVSHAVLRSVQLPLEDRLLMARMLTQLVYVSLARNLDDEMRLSKRTQPPVEPR